MRLVTKSGLDAYVCISALQKFIRRGMEREAMTVAIELGCSGKNFFMMMANRLEVITHEDIGLADPDVIPFVRTCTTQAKELYAAKKRTWKMVIGNAILRMARAEKSRLGDHFSCAVGTPAWFGWTVPEFPDYVFDKHTSIGKSKGRGLAHFRKHGAHLENKSAVDDPYEDEAFKVWKKLAKLKMTPKDAPRGAND